MTRTPADLRFVSFGLIGGHGEDTAGTHRGIAPDGDHAGTMAIMTDKVWTAEEFEGLTPAKQDELFAASLIRDPAGVPPDFLERIRQRARQRIVDTETQDR